MQRYILIRLLQGVFLVIVITTIVFALTRLSGDPIELMVPLETPDEVIDQIRDHWGLDEPWHIQYWNFMSNAAQGNFGKSFKWPGESNVIDLISERLGASLQITLTALVVASVIALALGVLTAIKRDTFWDYGGKALALLGQSAPSFWTAIMLIWVLGVELTWLPVAGRGEGWSVGWYEVWKGGWWEALAEELKHMVLPVVTLSAFQVAAMMRLVRSSMLDTLDSEYVKLARLKGIPEWKVVWKHCLRNAAITPITYFGLTAGVLMTGSVIVETVFAWPGIGLLMIDSIVARDIQVVQAATLVFAVIIIVLNLIVDIIYAVVDPRIRYGAA